MINNSPGLTVYFLWTLAAFPLISQSFQFSAYT